MAQDPAGRRYAPRGDTLEAVGTAIHVRTAGGSRTVEIIGLEVIGELTIPRTEIPRLIAALKRAGKP